MAPEDDMFDVEPPDGLADAVLARTSGSACRAAEVLLPDLVDEALHGTDAELVRLHLERCSGCAAAARALLALRHALPAMAEVDPGRPFTEGVLARTTHAPWRRLAASFRRLLLRPTFAMEGAYLGSVILVALVGLPGSPLRDVPRQTSSAVRALSTRTEGRLLEAVRHAERDA
jgi:anti-sigma factor RsiW